MTTHKEVIEAIVADLDGVRLMDSSNCSEAVWTALQIEDAQLKALVERIINSCAAGSIYDWAVGKYIVLAD